MFHSSRSRWSGIVAGLVLTVLIITVLLITVLIITEQPLAAQNQAGIGASETYQPGSFNPPYSGGGGYYGGGGMGGWGWGGGMGVGSTAAGSALTGMGNAIRAQGQFNLDTSAAAINLTEANRRSIENNKLWTETFFEKRRINQAYRDSQRRAPGNSETWIRVAHSGVPARLTTTALDPVTGAINWPADLMREKFLANRDVLDHMFADRALANGAIGPQTHAEISGSINQMREILKSYISIYTPNQYIESRNFLNSLAHEASLPASALTASR
jgi:hypothetical protein